MEAVFALSLLRNRMEPVLALICRLQWESHPHPAWSGLDKQQDRKIEEIKEEKWEKEGRGGERKEDKTVS